MLFPLLLFQCVVFWKKIDVQKETVVENYTSAGTAIFQDGSEFYFRLCHRYRRMKIRENPSEMPPLAYLLVSSRTSRENWESVINNHYATPQKSLRGNKT